MFTIKTKAEIYYGPFKTASEAAKWALGNLTSDGWIIIPLNEPHGP